ncbi:hypothetical protein BJ170DRAFT_381506 [Xylariales sp. AK1849]|nr:hypothetical protein BJ170DRAFT_381506 [Xylariales sp. AK1849]
MLFSNLTYALTWVIGFATVTGSPSAVDLMIRTRNAPGTKSSNTMRALGRALAGASLGKRDTAFKNSTSIEKSWSDATLVSFQGQGEKGNATVTAGVDIICRTCYVKAKAMAQLTVDGGFNVSQAFNNFTEQISTEFDNATTTVMDYVENYIESVVTNLADGLDLDDFDLPPIDVEFSIDMPEILACRLSFQFDDMELYMMIDTILSAGVTYNLNLYTSNTPIGISIGDEAKVGVIFTVDLILSAEAEIDISSGFHIRLDDGVAFGISLFGTNVSDTTFNGGSFEFLPVTVQSSGAVLKAVLRVGASAGFDLDPPDDSFGLDPSAGVMVGVFAHIAEFITNVTAAPEGDDNGCELRVAETYQLAIGAVAGATVALQGHTWGPVPATTIPVFYTTLADACAVRGTATSTATATTIALRADGDLTTKTISTVVAYTGVACISTELVNCPASLQTTTKTTSTLMFTTAVPSGVTPTFPATTQDTVPSTIEFGASVKALFSSAGVPASFVPTPSSDASPLGAVWGVDERIVIGVSVGVGTPLILAIVAGWHFCHRRKRYPTVPRGQIVQVFPTPTYQSYQSGPYDQGKRPAKVTVAERHYRY